MHKYNHIHNRFIGAYIGRFKKFSTLKSMLAQIKFSKMNKFELFVINN